MIEHKWHWAPLPELDQVESADAAVIRMTNGLTTPSEEHQRRGSDWDQASARAAADFGVALEIYKQAVFAKLFGVTPAAMPQQQPVQAQSGEYTAINQRAFNNNLKRIKTTLQQLITGEISKVFAEQIFSSIGLPDERAAKLIADAVDGRIDDPELQEAESE
jgi:hypothetical protein